MADRSLTTPPTPPSQGGERKAFRHSASRPSATKIRRSQPPLSTSQRQLFNSPPSPTLRAPSPRRAERGERTAAPLQRAWRERQVALARENRKRVGVSRAAMPPLLSWRVLNLPYMDQDGLFQRFHLDEAWDSPHNMPLSAQVSTVFRCPSEVMPEGLKVRGGGRSQLDVYGHPVADGHKTSLSSVARFSSAENPWKPGKRLANCARSDGLPTRSHPFLPPSPAG
jgi:hypothetical protein